MKSAMASAVKVVLLGEKSLAPRAIYDVAHGLARTAFDPAALDGICKGFPRDYNLLPPPGIEGTEGVKMLSVEESRAALLVFLHRLLESGIKVRKDVPILICEALNSGMNLELQVTNQPLVDVAQLVYDQSLGKLKERLEMKDFGLAKEELDALQASSRDSTSLGIAACSAHMASYLVEISDYVAGLSCEALKAKVPFDDKVYRQDSSHNSVADAAKTMRSLLLKPVPLRKGFEAECLSSIPEVHGSFKESCKSISRLLKVEINRVSLSGEKLTTWPTISSASPTQLGFVLVDAFSRMNVSLERLIFYSIERIKEGLTTINSFSKETKLDWVDELLNKFRDASTGRSSSFMSKLSVFRNSFTLVQTATQVVALEAAVALLLLSLREAQGPVQGQPKFVLGRGNACSRDMLVKMLDENQEGEGDVLYRWFEQLKAFFAPKDDRLQNFIDTVKALVDSSGATLAQVPKGTRDFNPRQMMIREASFAIISKVFKRHGAGSIDTPVFELRETLMGKYGEDSKLIYDLADQGGQMLSLRYDLTVPFARYLASNNDALPMRKFQIAKVYRRDNPSKGRYREFYQCDFDIAGNLPDMVPDMEVIKVLTELLDELQIGDYEIKLNHRKLLDGMLEICGVPANKFRSICSEIDKLDKSPWEKVRNDMVFEKGLSPEVADKIGEYVVRRGNPFMVLKELQQQEDFMKHVGSSKALADLSTLFRYLEAARCLDRVVFDLSLARGLHYYTGVIYEAVFKGDTQVGSIAAGGRYDDLIGSMFSDSKGKAAKQIPAVGVSLGIERVLMIRESQIEKVTRTNDTQVMILFIGRDMMEQAIELATELWAARINTEFECVAPARFPTKMTAAIKSGVPFIVVVGQTEVDKGIVKLKDIAAEHKERDDGMEVPRGELVKELQGLILKRNGN